jgi:hypothetical protein
MPCVCDLHLQKSVRHLDNYGPPHGSRTLVADIVLTPACVEQLKAITADDEYLRVTVDSGGCSGFEYKFKLDKYVTACPRARAHIAQTS